MGLPPLLLIVAASDPWCGQKLQHSRSVLYFFSRGFVSGLVPLFFLSIFFLFILSCHLPEYGLLLYRNKEELKNNDRANPE